MNLKTARILQIVAFVLFALALLISIACVFAQGPIKKLSSANPDIMEAFVIPYQVIIPCFIRALLALIAHLILSNRPTRDVTAALTIVMTALFVILGVGLSNTLVNSLITGLIANRGASVLAAHSIVTGFASSAVSFFSTPATLLMFLALGGACGKDWRMENGGY